MRFLGLLKIRRIPEPKIVLTKELVYFASTLIEIILRIILVSKTFPGFPGRTELLPLIKSFYLKEAILYSQSVKSGKCFNN